MSKYKYCVSLVLLTCIVLVIASCFQGVPDESETENGSVIDLDSVYAVPWVYDANGDTMVFNQENIPTAISVEKTIEVFNQKYRDLIYLELLKQSNDTVYLSINDAQYLTQSMGTTGAYGYLSEVTYSLTEILGVESISFQFKEGDHASPGVYKRSDFMKKL